MRKTLLIALLLILGLGSVLLAQTLEYSFSATQGTYTPITEGVSLGTETTDDQRFVDPTLPEGGTTTTGPGFPIGFNFTFNGAVFDRLAVNANGWISLGQSALTPSVNNASTSGYTPISSTTAITPEVLYNRIAGFARDIQAQAGATIRLQTIGTAPNRICVIQWTNYKKYGTTGTGDNYNFQIQLHETSNHVKIVYGQILNNATAGNMQVGLRGPLATDFNARAGTGAWTATTAATVNTDYVVVSDANYPANGLTFNFNFPVANQPPNPASIVSPANGATLVSPFATLNWMSGGGLPSGYRISVGTNNPPTNIVNNQDLGAVTTFDPAGEFALNTTIYWQVIPYNGFGNAANCPVWSFTTHGDATITTLPYSQNWDAVTPPALPFDWSFIYQASVTTGYVKTVTTSPQSTPNCIAMYNPTDINTIAMLIGPQLATNLPASGVRVKFWAKGSTSYAVKVGVMTNPTDASTFTEIQQFSLTSAWAQYSVSLASYTGTGRFIAFKHASLAAGQTVYIDGVDFEQIAPNDLAAVSVTGNTTPSVGAASNYTVNIFNNGTVSQSTYTVKLYNAANVELATAAGTTVAPGATVPIQLSWTPTVQGPASIYGKVILTGDVNAANDQTPPLAITVQPAGIMSVTIGTGETNARMPFDFFYKNSLYETLYFPAEIGMFGNITSLALYNQFTTTTLTSMPAKIWMGTTQLADLSAGWIPSGNLTLVFDGNLAFPAGENTITFPLQTPFTYSGGNLVVMFNRPMDTVYYSSADYFKCQTVGTNRALNMYSDSTVYDPAAPITGTLTGQFPKTTLFMTPLSPNPLFSVTPASHNFGTVLMNSTTDKSFSIMNAGGGTLSVSNITISGSQYFSLQNLPTLPANLTTGQSATFVVRYNPTVAGDHTATVTITDNRMVHTVAITGTSFDANIYTLPYSQNFDAVTVPALPIGWSSIYQASVTTGYVRTVTSSPQSTPNCVAMYNPTDINTIAMLIAPPLANAVPANTTRVKFWGKGTNYAVKVGAMTNPTDPASFTEIQQVTFTSAWSQYSVPLTTYTGTGVYIAFKHACLAAGQTIYLDTVEFELISPNDLAAISVTGNTTPSVGVSTPYTVSVFNNGTANQSTYTVKLFNGQNVELASVAGTTVAAGATVPIVLNWTPTAEGPQTLYGKVILAGDVNPANDQTPNLPITVMPQGVITVTIGDGSQTARMPIDMFYRNSVYQTLYYPDEIGAFGNITAVSIYNNFVTATLQNMPTKIWIGTTTQADLSVGWIPSTAMTLVFDGTMNYPAGQNTIVFPLTTPFAYAGGNLVIMWNRPMDTQYYSSSDVFLCQTVGNNRARNVYSDSTTYDPAAVTGGNLIGQFPKTTLTLTPMAADPIFNINPSSYSFGDINLGGTATATFTIRNMGGGTLTVNSVNIAGSPAFALANLPTFPVSLTTGQTSTFNVTFHPTTLNTFNAVVTITDNLAGQRVIGLGSRNDNSRTVHTVNLSGTGVNDITIGAGTTNARMPLDFYYKNSIYEVILTNAELNNFVGIITGIKLYSQFTSNLTAMPTKVWIGTTTQTDLATDWIPSTQLTSVFDGTLDYPSGENIINITFAQPFMYLNSQNLVIMFNRPMDTQYYSSSDYFKCQTIGTNRARNIYSDGTTYDPAAPTGGTVTGQFPKLTFVVIPGGVGHITGTVLGAGNTPLPGVAVAVTNTTYTATTAADGTFTIPNVLPNNYTVTFSKYGYNNHSQNITLLENETEIMNVTMTPMAQVNVTGTILASDTAAALANANIYLTGYQNYTGTSAANGTFTIQNVYANQSYAYTIIATGYTTASGTINVGATNHSMGNITLSEVAYAPFGVVAALNDVQTIANLSWQAPDPTAVDITESFEAATFPPVGWTQVINNTGPANSAGIYPTWCSFGTVAYNTAQAVPTDGVKQTGLWWDYSHQDEWLITPAFNCPPAAHLSFSTWVYRGSTYGDHYYVKISTDGGNQWTVLWDASTQTGGYTSSATTYTLDLEAYGGQQIKVAFQADDPVTDDGLWYGWIVDNLIIGNQMTTLKFNNDQLIQKSAAVQTRSNISAPGLSRAAVLAGLSSEPMGLSLSAPTPARINSRSLTGYKVWRLQAGQESNPSVWTSLTADVTTGLSFADNGWSTLPNGTYRWAVKAIYTNNVASVASLSNPLLKQLEWGNVVGVVRKPNTQPLAGATVSAAGYTATTNTVGAYSLALPVGTYSVSCAATGYLTQVIDNVNVVANQNTTLNFNMVVSADEDEVIPVTATALIGNHPNPFNPETTISYAIKDAGQVNLEIYNLKGQKVRTLVNARQDNGTYRVVFNSRDDSGKPLASGIYLYRLTTGTYSSTRKMMLME